MDRALLTRTRCLSRTLLTARTPIPRRTPRPFVPATHTTHTMHTSAPAAMQSRPPKSRDRGPKSDEDTQTDFSALDVLRNTAPPATSIDACTDDGFALNNNTRVSGCGLLLVGGEAFRWRPWVRDGEAATATSAEGTLRGRLRNPKGQWDVDEAAWGVLELVWPKPGMFFCFVLPVLGFTPWRDTVRWLLTLTHRSAHHRHRPADYPHCARGAQVPQWPRYSPRDPGYTQRVGAVQLACHGARCRADCRCAGADGFPRGSLTDMIDVGVMSPCRHCVVLLYIITINACSCTYVIQHGNPHEQDSGPQVDICFGCEYPPHPSYTCRYPLSIDTR
jgi:NADH dehydrogenase [ubiquinone] 1 alpha subcomplex assembly factor 3